MKYIRKFNELSLKDLAEVGGKNASLGELFNRLSAQGIKVPKGFAVTATAFKDYLEYNHFEKQLTDIMAGLDTATFGNLQQTGQSARALLMSGKFPSTLNAEITAAYEDMFEGGAKEVAIRSSATAEDLPEASFAGQHESYLNIRGGYPVLSAVKKCFASLYTDRAIKYRYDNGFDHTKVFLSVGIQEMIRSDLGCSGVGFTLEPESGFRNVVHIAGVWGLGENIVQGGANPDEFLVYKPALNKAPSAIIQKKLGSKELMMVYSEISATGSGVWNKKTPEVKASAFVLSDQEVEKLAGWSVAIEDHYGKAIDFEWAKDGNTQQLFIIQARPETVHQRSGELKLELYRLKGAGSILTTGLAIGKRITAGRARVLSNPSDAHLLEKGDILITNTTSPDWDPVLRKVAGVVTDQGGRTSHAAIVARELGAVAIVGTQNGTQVIRDGDLVTLSCAEGKMGYVYSGKLEWTVSEADLSGITIPEHPLPQLIIAEPEKAFEYSFLPAAGVGLLRLEFMISNYIRLHPMAAAHPEKIISGKERQLVMSLCEHYVTPAAYFTAKLAEGIAMIAAAFAPRPVIVRLSDFKSNEYAGLTGGSSFELKEDNPMIGFRGASRYCHERYKDAFALECAAIKYVREMLGLTNLKVMVPFCRSVEEGKKVIEAMRANGLVQGESGLEILVMAELPVNVLLAEQFAAVFDGFSIGSNDLTQMTLGVDRDSALVSDLFNEQNPATLQMIEMMIRKAQTAGKPCGLCGQAASDSETFTRNLVEWGIDSISFNPDALLAGIHQINDARESNQTNKKNPEYENA